MRCPLRLICPACGSAERARHARSAASARPRSPPSDESATPSVPDPPIAPAPVAERRLVTVLFADLVGFTPLAEERDAEEVRELLTRYFELAGEVIARDGGTVEKFIGDAVMAVWGAPTAHEDDAERAVRAGARPASTRSASSAPGIQARAGVVTGEAAVTIGAVGQGMVAGDLVNTASRLQSVAAAGVRPRRRGRPSAQPPRRDRLRAGRRAGAQGQGRPGRRLARPPGRRRARRQRAAATCSRPPSSAGPTSCASSRTSSTPRRASTGRASSRSPGRPGSARAASPGSSRSTPMASPRTLVARGPLARVRRRASRSGRSARWCGAGPGSRDRRRATTRDAGGRRRGRAPRRCRRAPLDRASPARAPRRRDRRRGPEQLFGAWRPSSSGSPRAPRRARLRGPPPRRPRPPRLHRPPARVEPGAPILVLTLARPELLERRPLGRRPRSFACLHLEPLPSRRCASSWRAWCPASRSRPSARSSTRRRRSPLRGRDRPDAPRRRAAGPR